LAYNCITKKIIIILEESFAIDNLTSKKGTADASRRIAYYQFDVK